MILLLMSVGSCSGNELKIKPGDLDVIIGVEQVQPYDAMALQYILVSGKSFLFCLFTLPQT